MGDLGKRHQRGQAMVEFALIAIALFTILLLIFDFGRAIFYYNMLSNGAREGARAGVIPTSTDPSRTEDYICAVAIAYVASGLPDVDSASATGCSLEGSSAPLIVHAWPGKQRIEAPPDGVPVVVTMDYEFTPVSPFLEGLIETLVTGQAGKKLTIHASSSMYVED